MLLLALQYQTMSVQRSQKASAVDKLGMEGVEKLLQEIGWTYHDLKCPACNHLGRASRYVSTFVCFFG